MMASVIRADDYDKHSCPVIRRAHDTYLAEVDDVQSWNPRTKQLEIAAR